MAISDLPEDALRKLTSQELADLALAADRERRRLERLGDRQQAALWDRESARLCAVLNS